MSSGSHAYSPLSPTQTHQLRSFASTYRRPLTTVAVLVVLPLLLLTASYPVHHGDVVGSLSSWTDSTSAHASTRTDAPLPVCDKTLLYTFSGGAGFASEYGIFYRAAVWAADRGYAVLVDTDPEWPYVNLNEYLVPPALECTPRSDWRTQARVNVSDEGWETAPHLAAAREIGRGDLSDRLTVVYSRPKPSPQETDEVMDVDPPVLVHPHHAKGQVLPAELTLEPAYKAVFLRLSKLVQPYWRPTQEIDLEINQLVAQHRLQDRLSIGVHVRMGDKAEEQAADNDRAGGESDFRQGNLLAYLRAAQEMLPLLEASPAGRALRRNPAALKPLLVVMSDSPHVSVQLQSGILMDHDFEVVQLPDPASQKEEGHNQWQFNNWRTWQQRIEAGAGFVRDITIVGRHTDAFIGTASSNVARLIALLCGPEKVITHKLVRSLDIPLYWTVDFVQFY